MIDGSFDEQEVAQVIEEMGTDILLASGMQTVKAIVDEAISSVRRVFADGVDSPKGRLALFYMTETDFRKIGKGESVTYDGIRWIHRQTKSQRNGNTVVLRTLLFESGAK